MNKLSRFVKNRMLAYPGSNPTRTHVLLHAYLCSGNGVRWTQGSMGGTLFDEDDRERRKIARRDEHDIKLQTLRTLNEIRDRIADTVVKEDLDQWYESALASLSEKSALVRAELDYVETHVVALSSTVDPTIVLKYDVPIGLQLTSPYTRVNPVYYAGPYEEPQKIIDGLSGMFPITIAKMPERVETSFFDGAIEVLDLVLRSIPDSEQKETLFDYRSTLLAVHERY